MQASFVPLETSRPPSFVISPFLFSGFFLLALVFGFLFFFFCDGVVDGFWRIRLLLPFFDGGALCPSSRHSLLPKLLFTFLTCRPIVEQRHPSPHTCSFSVVVDSLFSLSSSNLVDVFLCIAILPVVDRNFCARDWFSPPSPDPSSHANVPTDTVFFPSRCAQPR